MRVYISGQKLFGEAVYKLCGSIGIDVAGVCAPAFRGRDASMRLCFGDGGELPDRLRMVAENDGVPWLESGTLNAEKFPKDVDLIIAAHSYDYIGEKTLRQSRLGGIGYHPSLLPVHRGRDAIRWAVAMGDKVTGGTVYWMNKYVDCGPIAAQEWCFIRPGDTAETLWKRDLFKIGLRLFKKVLLDIRGRKLVRVRQTREVATWEPSFDRPPLYRPDLLMLGDISGYKVDVAGRDADDLPDVVEAYTRDAGQ